MTMNASRPLLCLMLVAGLVPLAGCLDGGGFDFEPGKGFTETGNTVHLRMWVDDYLAHEVYPGFRANLWAFCAEPVDPNDAYSAGAVEYWHRMETDGRPAGAASEGKCSVPGPTIRVQQGDRVIVDFHNDHFHGHTIHWHGQLVPWLMDGAPGVNQDLVAQGDTFRYDFVAKRAGTLWYHCHVDTHVHVHNGLFGVFIVEPQDDRWEPKDIDREYTLVLSALRRTAVEATPARMEDPHLGHDHEPGQCGTSGQPNCPNPPANTDPDTFMINGRSYPHTGHDPDSTIFMRDGEKIRIRLVNAGDTFETIHPHGHDMYVTHRDGNPINPAARFWVDALTIGPSERYDVVIHADNPGVWMIHTHVARHETNDRVAPGGMHTMMYYEGFEDQLHAFVGELPGGFPYQAPPEIPRDLHKGMRYNMGTNLDVEERWGFPIDSPACAVKRITFQARLTEASGNTGLPLPTGIGSTELEIRFRDHAGNAIGPTLRLGEDHYAQWVYDTNPWTLPPRMLQSGEHTVLMTGRAVGATVDFDLHVAYYNDQQELFENNRCGLGEGPIHGELDRE